LIAVLDGSKVADLLPKPPGHSNSTLFQGLDAAKLQQQLLTGLQLLFTKVVVTHSSSSSSRGKTNVSTSTTQPATTAAEAVQPQAQASPGPGPASAAATTRGSSSSGAAAGVRARRHRQRHRPRARPQQQITTTNTTANAQQAPDSLPNSTPAASATAAMTTNSSSNASSSTGTTAGDDQASSKPAAAAVTSSTGAAAGNNTAKQGQVAAPAHTPPGGGRRLLRQLLWTADTALSGHWPGLHRAWAWPPAAGPEAVTAAGTQAQHQLAASGSTAAHTALAAARQLMAAGATADRAQAAALFRHDGSVILQSNSRCSYQFLVTRNPGLLYKQPQQQGLQHGASSGGEGSSHKGSSWWISAGALFAGVSAVLALAICFMSAQLWARYKVCGSDQTSVAFKVRWRGGSANPVAHCMHAHGLGERSAWVPSHHVCVQLTPCVQLLTP